MITYAPESFNDQERQILRHYVTNLDGPVFALINLPEVVKGALFARYSRSAKSLRRLFIDEFVDDLDMSGDVSFDATVGLRRAEGLYERIFSDFGDDSVAQLGGVHLACEQASNVLTKVLEWGRLMAYLEQSTRYIPYDTRLSTGHYRYYRDSDILESPLGARYVGEMDRMFDTYASLLPELQGYLVRTIPNGTDISSLAYRQSIRAKALDALRGLLPAGSLSNVGIYGSGQSYELLLLRMRGHRLPEVRSYAELMLEELRKVIPSFLTRVDRPDRGGDWTEYLGARHEEMSELVQKLWPETKEDTSSRVTVNLSDYDPEGEDKVIAAMCYPYANASEETITERVRNLSREDRARIIAAYVGDRKNRRHRPGRAFERTSYRFDVVADYGAFRDLQRHRMLTLEWQPLGTSLGYEVPDIVEQAGLRARFVESLERSRELYGALHHRFGEQASYAVALGFNVRFVMQMNAREAMHVIELRSGPQGHPAYREVAQQMHRLIAERAGHSEIARAMSFVDYSDVDLGRLQAELRSDKTRSGDAGPQGAKARRNGEGNLRSAERTP
jgi:thymidylate synthase ThyX